MAQGYIVDADGVYFFENGAVHRLDTASHVVNADGSLTLRIPARDVVVRNTPDVDRTFDMTDLARLKLAYQFCGLTVAQVNAVRPAVAAALQSWATTNSITSGTSQ